MHGNDDLEFFNRIPWCSRLVAAPDLKISTPSSRTRKATKEDSLFAETIKTSGTISAALYLHPKPSQDAEHVDAVSTLLALGDGLNGHPSVLHGGIVATIIDEAMGVLLHVNADRAHVRAVATGHASGETSEGCNAHTAQLNIKYLSPVKTPGVVLVEIKVTKREGRKTWIQGKVIQKSGKQEELDGQWIDCAVGEALFVEPRSQRL